MSMNRELISLISHKDNEKVSEMIVNMDAQVLNKPMGHGMGHFLKTALGAACTVGNIYALDLLLAKPNIDLNVMDNTKRTPLFLACQFSHHRIVGKLLAKPGIDVNVTDNHGETPIMWCVYGGCEAAFKLMLDHPRVDLEVKNDEGKGLEDIITGRNFTEQTMRKYLVVKKRKLDEKMPESAEDRAARDQRKLEAVKELLECPICLQTMRPPARIWMCSFTHVVCDFCLDRLGGRGSLCPTCKSKKITLRAFHLETFAQKVFGE